MIGRTRARVTAVIAAAAGLTAPTGLLFSGAASAAGSVHRFNHVVIPADHHLGRGRQHPGAGRR
jgi:hypothetical protein